jgi:hypothetical protein
MYSASIELEFLVVAGPLTILAHGIQSGLVRYADPRMDIPSDAQMRRGDSDRLR